MPNKTLSVLSKAALIALLAATAGCQKIERAYNSAYSSIAGSDETTAPKPAVRSPNAAPVQAVGTSEITSGASSQPVVLGSMSDTGQPQMEAASTTTTTTTTTTTQDPVTAEPVVTKQTTTQTTETIAPAQAPMATAPAQQITPITPQPMAAPAPTANVGTVSLLTVRFNQPHVYYDDALAKAVAEAERVKPGVVYDVLSTVPDLSSLSADQQTKLSSRAKDNLRNVVVKMQQLGVPAERIRIAEQTLKIRSQEIQLFVR